MYKIEKLTDNNSIIVATKDIAEGDVLGVWVANYSIGGRYLFNEPMTERWYETVDLGRYCNHSDTPNTSVNVLTLEEGRIELVLISNGIFSGEEIVADYNIVERETGYVVITNY